MFTMASSPTLLSVLGSLNFDVKSGVELCGGDLEFYAELIRELYDDVLPLGSDVLTATDLQKQRDYAHKLKGTFSTLGAVKASAAAFELEHALREGRPSSLLAGELLQEIDRIRAGLSVVFR